MQVLTLGLPKEVSRTLHQDRFVETHAEDIEDLLSLADIDGRTRSYRFEMILVYIGKNKQAKKYPHQISRTNFLKPLVTLYDPNSHTSDDCTQWYRAGSAQVISYRDDTTQIRAAVWSLVRLMHKHKKSTLEFGDLTIDIEFKEVAVRGELIKLNQYEYEVLEFLALRNGHGVRHEEILWRLYGTKPFEDEPEIKIVEIWISKLRKSLQKYGVQDVSIETDWGRGYRLKRRALPENLYELKY